MNKWIFIFLALIVALAFFLRFYKVTEIPPSLNWDEVSIGYNAYSILKTGRDEWGIFLPIHFQAFGEFKLPVQIYASIPAIAILGLNDLGVRLTPVIYGTFTVLLLFFLGRKIFKSNFVGLISALLLAISPWHIQLTRASFESSFAVLWVSLGALLFIKGLDNKKWLILSMIPFAISIYTYNSARAFIPFFLLALGLIYFRSYIKYPKEIIISGAIFAILITPLAPSLLSSERSARFKLVSVTDDPGLIPRINENRGLSTLPGPLPRLVHNKVTYISIYTVQNYLAHFTPNFLFISGAPHKQHHVQNMGQLYLFQAPFLLLGLYFLFKRKMQHRFLLSSWVLLAFIPVSVTQDSIPHALRTLIAVPFYQLLTAFGGYQAYKWLREKNLKWQVLVGVVLTLIVTVEMGRYLNNYYNIYPNLYSHDWQYGNKQVVEFIEDNQSKYDEIVFTRHFGEPHIFTLFYLNYDPGKYQNDPNLIRFETYDWVRVLRFDKYYFPDLGDKGTTFTDIVAQNPGKKRLFVGKPGDFPDNLPRLKKINFLNGDLGFELVESR